MLTIKALRTYGPHSITKPCMGRTYSSLPRFVQPSMWQSLVPKRFRKDEVTTSTTPNRALTESKPWNPATFFIVIFLLIGSNSINMIAVKKDYLQFSRRTDAKIASLKEAIERVQRGEDVDVKKMLGTGNPKAEQEWEDVLKELEQEKRPEDTKVAKRAAQRAEKQAEMDKIVQQEEDEEWSMLEEKYGKSNKKAIFY